MDTIPLSEPSITTYEGAEFTTRTVFATGSQSNPD